MTASRLVRTVCLLSVLTAATGLVASVSARNEEQLPRQSPSLLWQTFPLRERGVHQFAATSHAATAAHRASTERNARAERPATTKRAVSAPKPGTTVPPVIAVVAVVGIMLAALALVAVRLPRTSRPGSSGAEVVGFRPAPVSPPAAAAPEPEPEPEPPWPTVRPAPEQSTPRREVAPDRPPAQQPDVERCEIVLWTGYVKRQLYAAPSGPTTTLESLQDSSYFRLRDADIPGARAERALEELLGRLESAGWQVVSKGARWYQYRLERWPWHGESQPVQPRYAPAPSESQPL
jgi:hypothetical protein